MKKIATLAVAGLLGLGLATAADAQQRPMGASGSSSGSSMSQSSQSSMPAKSSTTAKKSSAKKSSTSASAESVKAVQTALNKNGATLKVDGKMGPGTRAALKKYQTANGLKATGRVDDATKTKLGV
jgi:peptidoglycan hydrolase-like protein with peptidoglycan-binding domain